MALQTHTLTDCGCKAKVYDNFQVDIEYCNKHWAAPELLEACEALTAPRTGIVDECPADLGEGDCTCGLHRAVKLARAAIAKAKGE